MREFLRGLISTIREFLVRHFKWFDEKLPYIITVIIGLILVVGGINLFIELTETLTTDTLAYYDEQITQFFVANRTPGLTKYMLFVTYVGDVHGYLIVLALCILVTTLVFKRWKWVLQISLVLALSAVSNMILKRFIDRARPGIEHMVSVETLSYPSGHAMSAMAFYGFLIFIFYRFKMNPMLKIASILLLAFLILSIGISRIYLGVHFPSDIVGGFIAGFIWVVFCVLLFYTIELFRRDPKT
ncbi:phosphatase PAP2 family protein [Aegicerativicinus sediminis]|uniref:phosphatase PAP2 family protein n=1 Tax=Aegicerativicinus sediminis TaxID=2893202 RepID=UPI001E499CAB|nr:phosphatase PAP2 family protein [Aegicerativicinus sediminis]